MKTQTCKVVKIEDGKWNVVVGGKVVSTATRSSMYGGSYKTELENGRVIHAVSQGALSRMVLKYL